MSLKTEKIWFDGELVRWEEAKIHVLAHALHYGTAYFEGIRCYALADGRSAVFRLEEHIRRLADSGKILGFPLPYTVEQLQQATLEVIRANRLKECYIRPLVFLGLGEMGLYAPNNPINVCIAVWPWGAYLGDEGIKQWHPREGILVYSPPRERDDDQEQGVGELHQLRTGQNRSQESGLRRSDHARCRGLCLGSQRGKHLHRP